MPIASDYVHPFLHYYHPHLLLSAAKKVKKAEDRKKKKEEDKKRKGEQKKKKKKEADERKRVSAREHILSSSKSSSELDSPVRIHNVKEDRVGLGPVKRDCLWSLFNNAPGIETADTTGSRYAGESGAPSQS